MRARGAQRVLGSGRVAALRPPQNGAFMEDMIPTVGFNMRKVTKGNVTMKLWDIGGQPRFRSMWERYCRGVNAIVYEPFSVPPGGGGGQRRRRPSGVTNRARARMLVSGMRGPGRRFVVDSADQDKMEGAKSELKNLLDKPQLAGIPILVLGNKNDLPGALTVEQVIDRMYVARPPAPRRASPAAARRARPTDTCAPARSLALPAPPLVAAPLPPPAPQGVEEHFEPRGVLLLNFGQELGQH